MNQTTTTTTVALIMEPFQYGPNGLSENGVGNGH
jgi:hypothetical protein